MCNNTKFNIEEITLERVEMVGPKVGRDLREKALLSILYAIIGIVIYKWFSIYFPFIFFDILHSVLEIVSPS